MKKEEKEFFPVPMSLITDGFPKLGTRGIALYCLLASFVTREEYPSPIDLGSILKVSLSKVKSLLHELHKLELLNKSDMRQLLGSEFTECLT